MARLRNYMKNEKSYEDEKASQESKLERLDFGTIKRKKNELLAKYDRLEKSKSENKGRLVEMDVSIKGLERELQSDK